jgi:hypothetical protein
MSAEENNSGKCLMPKQIFVAVTGRTAFSHSRKICRPAKTAWTIGFQDLVLTSRGDGLNALRSGWMTDFQRPALMQDLAD